MPLNLSRNLYLGDIASLFRFPEHLSEIASGLFDIVWCLERTHSLNSVPALLPRRKEEDAA